MKQSNFRANLTMALLTLSLVVDCGNAVFSPARSFPDESFDTQVAKHYFRESPMS